MTPSLPPEILARIARSIKGPVSRPNWIDREQWAVSMEDQVREEQDLLLEMMKCSKALYDATAPVVYDECRVGNIGLFFQSMRSGQYYDKVKRLHLYHPSTFADLYYPDIFEAGRWNSVAYKTRPNDQLDTLVLKLQQKELKEIIDGGVRFRELLKRKAPVLPNMRHVILGGLGDLRSDHTFDIVRGNCPSLIWRSMPIALLDTPNLESICQARSSGPLTLPGIPIKPQNGPRVFTYHPRPFSDADPIAFEQHPIVIGATNRYYYNQTGLYTKVVDHKNPEDRKKMLEDLAPIINLLHPTRTDILVTTLQSMPGKQANLGTIDVSGTTIELYNHIRMSDWSRHRSAREQGVGIDQADVPLSLATFQTLLDSHIHPKWRGKVFFKNREDVPPCASCGYVCAEEDEYAMFFRR